MRSAIYTIFLTFVMFSFATTGQSREPQDFVASAHVTLLSSGDWKMASYPMGEGEKQNVHSASFDDHNFRTVKVPGEVQVQLGLTGMDRYYQTKELSTANDKEWWYRKQFVVPKEDRGKLLRLEFEGVDYYASVWLNGKKLGEHEGAYTAFSYDVSSAVNYGAENTLAVKVTCPWFPTDRGFGEYLKGDWMMPDPTQMSFEREPYVLGPYWGGVPAYGNAVFPMGLFRDVKMVVSGWVVVEDVFVRTQGLDADASANLEITGTVRNYAAQDVSAKLGLRIEPENFSGAPLTLPAETMTLHPGRNAFRREVVVKDAHLWWTWDLGNQDLYKLTAAISPATGMATDSTIMKFGIRTISRQNDMSYWLNGKRLFLKGAWYPMADYFGSEPTEETYIKDLVLFRAANLNHIVNFTVVEKPIFYDLCDQMGIMIITELPFGQFGPMQPLNPSYPRHESFVKSALSQVEEIIVALRNHPSIVEWAAFAESHQKSTGGWGFGSSSFAAYDYQSFSEEIGKLVAKLDGGTIYQPSLCDFGEQHFWMAGTGSKEGYNQHFNAEAGFVSEYGSLALPSMTSLEKFLSSEDLWGDKNQSLPQWFNLPIRVPAYAYLTSFEYEGVYSILSHVHEFVDRNINSAQELVDDTQLYQAFLMKYATEVYRRKMHKPINGIRIWAYVEAAPGIQWGFVDYNRTPKMAYYYVRKGQEQFDLNFAQEQALESQVLGNEVKIPIWIVNEHRAEVRVQGGWEIDDLQGREIRKNQFATTVGPDASQQVGEVSWVPEAPGVYVLRGQATEVGGKLRAEDRTFIKVTPRLLPQPARVLLIGEKKYALPIGAMLRAMGMKVQEIYEEDFFQLKVLKSPEAIKRDYDVVWLASFDSAWKLLNNGEAEGLRQAVSDGVAFVHTGGPGSFHGGYGKGACLEFTPLAEVLPVSLRKQNDLVYGERTVPQGAGEIKAGRITEIAAADQGAGWDTSLLKKYGLEGFNEVNLKEGSHEALTITGRPLLVEGHYGQGRTMVFTGFTPEHVEEHAFWDPKVVFPYLVDQELYANPETKAYFDLFMRIMARVMGETPAGSYEGMRASREKPLFETLKDQPRTELKVPESVTGVVYGDAAELRLNIENEKVFARLVRVSTVWDTASEKTPYLETYSDNYFDLLPGENKTIDVRVLVRHRLTGIVKGHFTVQGSNVPPVAVPIALQAQ